MKLFAEKLGLEFESQKEEVSNFFYQCLQFLEKSKAPYSPFFHHLYCWHQNLDRPLREYSPQYYDNSDLEEIEIAMGHLQRDKEAIEKSENDFDDLVIDEIEKIWEQIDRKDDWSLFEQKVSTR